VALTSSQVDHYRQILIARRDQLASATARAESEVPEQDDLNQFDDADKAVADVTKDGLLQEAGRDSEQLAQIESALAHIAEGTYGICDMCGEYIPTARLDAVPWALLCVRDQEVADAISRRRAGTMSGGAPSRVVS
jgi:RNA polymerase-binding protein DksA